MLKKHLFDIVFLPQNLYHTKTMLILAQELKKNNINSCFINPGKSISKYNYMNNIFFDLKIKQKFKVFAPETILNNEILYSTVFCMNDWDKEFTNLIVNNANKINKKSVALIEGINDFNDVDTGRKRYAYKSVKYLLLSGEDDMNYFKNEKIECHIVGIPRLELIKKDKSSNSNITNCVLINLNFSYNVLTNFAEDWLNKVVYICKEMNLNYLISKHPFDSTNTKELVSSEDLYTLIKKSSLVISRFSSVILESLALNTPVVYFNPENMEKVEKFLQPKGAYSLATNSEELKKAVEFELNSGLDTKSRAMPFLSYHANFHKNSIEELVKKVTTIIEN